MIVIAADKKPQAPKKPVGPKVVPTPGDPVEEFYDSSVGQMSLAQDDFIDPALSGPDELYSESLSTMMGRDEKIKSELAALSGVGFDISTPDKIDRLRPLMWKDLEDYSTISHDEYSSLLNSAVQVEPDAVDEPTQPSEPPPPVPSVQPTQSGPKEPMPSYDEIVEMARQFVSEQDNPNRGKFWVERQIIKKRTMLNDSGLDGDAFESQIRSIMKSMTNPSSFDD